MRLKTNIFETWVEHNGARFLVRELPASKQKEIRARASDNAAAYIMEGYSNQIRNWENVSDENGTPFPFSQENLRLAIENDLDSLNEVMTLFWRKLAAHGDEIRRAEKN